MRTVLVCAKGGKDIPIFNYTDLVVFVKVFDEKNKRLEKNGFPPYNRKAEKEMWQTGSHSENLPLGFWFLFYG